MAVLVTGAAGFIGAATSRALLERGEEVVGIDNLNDYYDPALKQARLASLATRFDNRFRFERVDFADTGQLRRATDAIDFDRIVHLGAQAGVRYSIENPGAYIQSNLVGHANMLELARARRPRHMVYASSPLSMAGTRACRSASRIGSTIRCRSMRRPRRPTSCSAKAIRTSTGCR